MRKRPIVVLLLSASGMMLLAVAVGCFVPVDIDSCSALNTQAMIDVGGTFRYSGAGENIDTSQGFVISGTITFEQDGNRVRVTNTTYDFSGLRALQSEFTELDGNRLLLEMTPINGDTDYTANVGFLFSDDGGEFCVEFMDTNNDQGDLGSFVGERVVN